MTSQYAEVGRAQLKTQSATTASAEVALSLIFYFEDSENCAEY